MIEYTSSHNHTRKEAQIPRVWVTMLEQKETLKVILLKQHQNKNIHHLENITK